MNSKPEVKTYPLPLQSIPNYSFKILEKLGSQKITAFLIFSQEDHQVYALKLFPYIHNKINQLYAHEARFCYLSHVNVVKFLRTQNLYTVSPKDKTYNASYVIMELARYKDFSYLTEATSIFEDEKVVRTYFHQLLAGIQYLHSQGVAHMDLRPENLLLAEDLNLKISNFHVAHEKNDTDMTWGGIKNYTAPELLRNDCTDPQATDIYSAGIILFVLMTGYFPYMKDAKLEGYDLEELLRNEDPLFWKVHAHINKNNKKTLSPEFKSLFLSMVREDVFERATIEEIKNSSWYKGPVYSTRDLRFKLATQLAKADVLSREE